MIPKTIHYLWLSDEKPDNIIAGLETWKRNLEGYEIIEWNKSNFPYNDFIWTKEAFSVQKWAFVTDYFRLWVLKNYGGIYLDADIIVRKNFDDFLHHKMFIGTELSEQLGPHVIGAEKDHPFITKCLEYYKDKHFIINGELSDKIIIPHIMTKILSKEYSYKNKIAFFDNNPLLLNDIAIYNDTFFTINVYNNCNVCYHNCMGSWRDNYTKLPDVNDFISSYFIRKIFTYDIKNKGLIGYILLLLPSFIPFLIFNFKMKIKHNRRINRVKL